MNSILSTLRKRLILRAIILGMILPGIAIFPCLTYANPAGGVVVSGNVNFAGLGTANLAINQASNLAIIDWQSFSIGAGEITTFNQPGVNSLALNRVVTGNPSAIYGQLRSNGGVIVINPNGIVVGPNGVVDTGGFLGLSTLDITNKDFLNGGKNRYRGVTSAGVANYGALSSQNGDIVMLGNFLKNAGSANAGSGTVAFGSGGDIIVDQAGGATISILSGGVGGAVGIENTGTINGAAAELKAHGNVYALAIKNDGLVRASGYKFKGGRLTLNAGPGGSVVNTGDLYARNSDGSGGVIQVAGSKVELDSGSVDASGAAGMRGGNVVINGDDISIGSATSVSVSGSTAGNVDVTGVDTLSVNGSVTAVSSVGDGGSIDLHGDQVSVGSTASLNASGLVEGGTIRVGGGIQGNEKDVMNSSGTTIAAGASLFADSDQGDGGTVIIWSDGDTLYHGAISAQARGAVGNGGFVEVSGKRNLKFRGTVSTASANGRTGTLLLDPTDVTIVATGSTLDGTITEADINAALVSNNLIIHTGGAGPDTGNILVEHGVRIEWGTPNTDAGNAQNFHDFTLLANGDITVQGHIISHGAGNVNLFAGWDGVSGLASLGGGPIADTDQDSGAPLLVGAMDFAGLSIFGTPGSGTVFISTTFNDQAVQVGSRFGETNVIAHDLVIAVPASGNDRFAHLGYRATTNWQSGGAGVYGLVSQSNFRYDDAIRTGNNAAVVDLTATLGADARFDAAKSGDINVQVQGDVLMLGSTSATRKYTQIGHGGSSDVRDQDQRTGGTANAIEYSLMNADHSGNITVDAGLGGSGLIHMKAGRETAPSRIGHGGLSNPDSVTQARGVGAYKGDIHVKNHNGNILAFGNPSNGGWAGFVQIGHGGARTGRMTQMQEGVDTGPVTQVGNDTVNNANLDQALGPRAIDPDMKTVDGNAAGYRGNITVHAENGSVIFEAGGSSRSNARIGHGGHENPGNVGLFDAFGNVLERADITVYATNDISFTAPIDNDAQRFVQIGHGGWRSPGNIAGNIDVDAVNGKIEFRGGHGDGRAQLGHGGVTDTWGGAGDPEDGIQGTLSGHIDVTAGTDITFRSGLGWADRAFSLLGHGGYGVNALSKAPDPLNNGHHGDISVLAGGAIDFMASQPEARGPNQDVGSTTANQSFTMIGHGGRESRGNHYGKISVVGGSIRFEAVGGWTSNRYNGSTLLTPTATSQVTRGEVNFAQIGHGGYDSEFQGGADQGGVSDSTVGHLGGVTGGPRDSTITVTSTTGDISFIAPQMATIVGQGAHRDSFATGRWKGYIDPGPDATLGTADDIPDPDPLITGYSNHNWVQIGHGGESTRANAFGYHGDITITSAGAFSLVGSDFQQAFVSSINLPIAFRDNFNSRRSERNYSHVGHGGFASRGDKSGVITITAENDISMNGGMGLYDYTQIGHGGWDSDNGGGNNNLGAETRVGFDGSVSVISNNGNVFIHAGLSDHAANVGDYAYAQIGHGGRSSASSVEDDDIIVRALGGNVEILAGIGFRELYAMIGHGGRDSRAQFLSGNIEVTARDNVYMRSTENGYGQASNFSQIGHGGWDNDANQNNDVSSALGIEVGGDITVTAETGDVVMIAGVDNTSAKSGGAGNFRYQGAGGVQQTGYNGNAANPRSTDFGPGTDGDFGYGVDNIGWNADDDPGPDGMLGDPTNPLDFAGLDDPRRNNFEQPGLDGDITTTADNTYGGGAPGVRPESAGYMYAGRGSQTERYDNDNNVTAGADGILLTADDANRDFDSNIRSSAGWVQIGHGGQHTNITQVGDKITVTAGNNLTMMAGEFRDARVAIGSSSGTDPWGSNMARRRTRISGDIDVTVGNDLEVYAASGDNATAKIGHGGYQTSSDRSRVEGTSPWNGDIHVKVGNDAVLDAGDGDVAVSVPTVVWAGGTLNRPGLQDTYAGGTDFGRVLIGHRDRNDNRAHGTRVSTTSGNTYFAVSRDNPDFINGGVGSLTTRVSAANLNGVVFSSAGDGLAGHLRLYMPNRPQNEMADGTILNGAIYADPGTPAVSLAAGDFRGDENLDVFEFTFPAAGIPTGDFTPEGPYSLVNGLGSFYQVYYNNIDLTVLPPTIPTGPTVFDFFPFFFDKLFDSFERGGFLLDYDGYEEGQLDSMALDDGVEGSGGSGGSFFERVLDNAVGPRRRGYLEGEENEELVRIKNRQSGKVGRSGLTFYVFDPGTNIYSSYRVFGTARTDTAVAQ